MFRKKGEFLGVYDYADEVYEVYPHPIEGSLIGVMRPTPTICMYVDGKWRNIVASPADVPVDLKVESLGVSVKEQVGQGDVTMSGNLNVGNDASIAGNLAASDINGRDITGRDLTAQGGDLSVSGDAFFDGEVYIMINGQQKILSELLGE